ncbi:alpha/beta hydrolase [Staphylococcus sp. SQ8-PEA]|uniref:Alpha/beta hydrolase n=1 Tax=Staphylococcus marylandisciuri TaxID=2981529 RepID=A0ABT2QS93_9STAP|nr:alpha/beta hydrolase [Staphylococcus marylandisciuri]MCU5746814.1 alpha/beta hydrolase [Staphylococcus marylandisciuri]
MTDVIIVHSVYGGSSNHWYEWLGNNLELEGYNVTLFNLSTDHSQPIDVWIEEMKQQISIDTYETYFVTHGFGTIASLKFLEDPSIKKVEGFFSISGFKEDAKDIDENINLDGITIDYDKVKSKVDRFFGLSAKDDQYVSYKETERLMQALDGRCRVTNNGGHFLEDNGFTTFTRLQERMQGIMSD